MTERPLTDQLADALRGVIRVADRNTVEFDAARTALSAFDNRAPGDEVVAWLRDAHEGVGDECFVPAAKGDPGAFPVYRAPPAKE